MKSLILLLIFVGVIFMTIGYIKSNQMCPPPIVKFRYYPKTFEQEMNNPVPVLSIFGKMFSENQPWIGT